MTTMMTVSEYKILKVLVGWNHQAKRANPFSISMQSGVSQAHTSYVLRKFKALGWVKHSRTSVYSVYGIKEKMKDEVNRILSENAVYIQHDLKTFKEEDVEAPRE